MGLDEDFLDLTPNIKATKAKTDTPDYIQLKSFCTGNYQKREKENCRIGENMCKSYRG